MSLEIKILRNTKSKRLILVDIKTGLAFYSFGKENKMYDFFEKYYSEEITEYKPISLKSK